MSERSARFTRAGVRVVAGLSGIAASIVVVTAAFSVTLPSAQAQPESRTVSPVPASALVACPGPLLSLSAGATASSSVLTSLGAPSVAVGGSAKAPASTPLDAADVQSDGTEPQAFEEPTISSAREPLLAAAQSQSVGTDDVHGLAVANCVQPDYDQWLVGGATSLGATALLVLSNPGDVAATVNIDVYFEQGIAQSAGGRGIVVAPHTQHVVPLSGLAPNASATVVHVTSTGGTVSAQLQDSSVSGITPQGVEWVGPTAAPATRLVIPGAVIDTTSATAGTATDSDDAGVPVLRVLPTGGTDAKLTITARAETGSKGGMATSVTVAHGQVSEVPLSHLGAGTFTVTVGSSVPVVAAVQTTTVNAHAGTDFAWYAAAAPLTGEAAIPVALGPGGRLHLVNPSSKAITVKLAGPGGGSVAVPAGGSAFRALKHSGVLTTADGQGLYASVSYASAGHVAAYLAYPTGASASALTVYRR